MRINNHVFEIAHQESVKVYSTHICSREKQFMIDGCI